MSRRVSVIIVSWNSREYVRNCVRSALASASRAIDVEVILSDNGSSDGTPDAVSEEFPGDAEEPPSELFTRDLGLRLGLALPLLKDICRVGIWRCNGEQLTRVTDVVLEPASTRRSYYPGKNEATSVNEMGGTIRLSENWEDEPAEITIRFDGQEVLLEDPAADDFRKDPHWPKRLAQDAASGGN